MAVSEAEISVSVLLPTYNRAGYIAEALDSLLNQTPRPCEIIILDDGSSDDTAAVCARYGQEATYVSLRTNRGKTAAINHGLSLARGDFVWIMDDDDIAPPNALGDLLAPLRLDRNLGFSFGALRKFRTNARGERVFEGHAKPDATAPASIFVHLMEDCFITGQPCVLFRRDILASLAPFDENVVSSVDYNILLEVARRAAGVDVKSVVLWQRQHDGGRGTAADRYSAAARSARWRNSDRMLIARLLPQVQLNEYLGLPARPLTVIEIRRAHFQKAVIAGRKELWAEAARCIRIGLGIRPGEPLSAEGATILSRLFGSRYGIDAFLADRATQNELASDFVASSVGRQASYAVCAQLPFWLRFALRRGRLLSAFRVLAVMVRLAGWSGAGNLMHRAMQQKLQGGALGGLPAAKASNASYAAHKR